MSRSLIYAGNNAVQALLAAGTTINFNNIVRRFGCNLNVSGGNVVIEGSGYYEGFVNLTVEGTVAGNLLLQVYKDGVAVPYANATVALTADSLTAVSIPFVVKQTCNCVASTITVIATGVSANINNAAITVEKE